METAIVETASAGLLSLFQLGAVVTVLILVILGGYALFKRAIDQCEKREDRAIQNWEKANDRSILFFDNITTKNNDAWNAISIVLARVEATLNAKG